MEINEPAELTGLSGKTISYYESISVLPQPKRLANGYRVYDDSDADRLKFVIGLRRLDFSLNDIIEIFAMRDCREAPCRVVLDLLRVKVEEVSQRIKELLLLETELHKLHSVGITYTTDDVDGKNCVCHLVSNRAESIGHPPDAQAGSPAENFK
jgi:DNA-binding transcriptional MerR regulator